MRLRRTTETIQDHHQLHGCLPTAGDRARRRRIDLVVNIYVAATRVGLCRRQRRHLSAGQPNDCMPTRQLVTFTVDLLTSNWVVPW